MAFFILLLIGKLLEIANKTRKEYFQIFLRDIWNINYMNDKSIRKILIAYLKTKNVNMRIYQEKGIGNSICEVMVVEDCLIGYEIKSDLDNYSRLNERVKAYTLFFDKNYIVVSDRHMNSIAEKYRVPGGLFVYGKIIFMLKEMEKNDDKIFKAILNDYKNVFTEEFIDKNNGKDAEINICGFYVCVADNSNKKKKNIYLIKNGIKYAIELGNSSVGNIRRIVNQLKGFDKELVKIKEKQEQKKRRYNQLSIEKDINNPYVEQIKECKRMCELLKSKIR